MEFLKNHVEKLVMAIALIALMASAVLVAMRIGGAKVDNTIPPPKQNSPSPLDQDALDRMQAQAQSPSVWKTATPQLFGSVPRWWEKKVGKWGLVAGAEGPPTVGEECEGIPRQWFKDHGLDFKEAGICDKDSDNDGWTNAEEYKFRTKPNDDKSLPAITDHLFLENVVRKDFILRFKGYLRGSADSISFQINVRDAEFTYFNKIGEQIASGDRKENYRVESFEPKTEEVFDPTLNAKRTVDISVLVISRLEDGSKISLVLGKTATETTLGAVLLNKLSGRQFQVAKEEQFKIRGETYKVVDIKNDGVIISDSLKREFSITAPKTGE